MYRQRAREVFWSSFLENASVPNVLAVPRDGDIRFECCNFVDNVLDVLTKALPLPALVRHHTIWVQNSSECVHSDWSEMWKSARVLFSTSSVCLYIVLFLCIFFDFSCGLSLVVSCVNHIPRSDNWEVFLSAVSHWIVRKWTDTLYLQLITYFQLTRDTYIVRLHFLS